MGGTASVESHLSAKDIYKYVAMGFTVAEVEHAFRRFRGLKISSTGSNGFRAEGTNLIALPPLPKGMPDPDKLSKRGTAVIDNKYGTPIFLEQLKMDWLLARVYYSLVPPGAPLRFEDYLKLMLEWRDKPFEDRLKFIFNVMDYDQDGELSVSDICIFVQQLSHQKIAVGDRVRVRTDGRIGTLRYWGDTKFAPGVWAGLELDEESKLHLYIKHLEHDIDIFVEAGKNDGSVKGVKYFECKPSYGVFVPSTVVILAEQYDAALEILDQFAGYGRTGGVKYDLFVSTVANDAFCQPLLAL
ncbi:hypothetical protein HDV05_001141 [Chytridiales sp. JEL 0842]|nr:hypothetical protein HDV05_001141 [Chytridiales sp. JEL 0842]